MDAARSFPALTQHLKRGFWPILDYSGPNHAASKKASKVLQYGSLLISLSLPVPSVLNIRLTAKQHNVVQLTGS